MKHLRMKRQKESLMIEDRNGTGEYICVSVSLREIVYIERSVKEGNKMSGALHTIVSNQMLNKHDIHSVVLPTLRCEILNPCPRGMEVELM